MDIPQRKAVSPIIATLLLIAIAVAAGIIVYVFVNGLAGNLTKSGGSQVTDQLSLSAYTYNLSPTANVTIFVQNTGTGPTSISSLYFDGTLRTLPTGNGISPQSCARISNTVPVGTTCSVSFTPNPVGSAGTSHSVKLVTTNGGEFTYNVVAGSSG